MKSILGFYCSDLPMQPFSLRLAKAKLLLRFAVVMSYVLFGAHFLWLLVSCESENCKYSWVESLIKKKHLKGMYDIHLHSIYRVASLLSSGGVGDVNPISLLERGLATILMLIGFFGSAYLQALVTSHIRTVANVKDVHSTRIAHFMACLNANGVK